jgi:hypothetical protein
MKAMQRKGGPHLLKEHAPITLEATIAHLEGRPVIGDAGIVTADIDSLAVITTYHQCLTGKAIYLVENGQLRMFPSFETFLNMKFKSHQVTHVKDSILQRMKIGLPLPLLTDEDLKHPKKKNEKKDNEVVLKGETVEEILAQVQQRMENTSMGCWGKLWAASSSALTL